MICNVLHQKICFRKRRPSTPDPSNDVKKKRRMTRTTRKSSDCTVPVHTPTLDSSESDSSSSAGSSGVHATSSSKPKAKPGRKAAPKAPETKSRRINQVREAQKRFKQKRAMHIDNLLQQIDVLNAQLAQKQGSSLLLKQVGSKQDAIPVAGDDVLRDRIALLEAENALLKQSAFFSIDPFLLSAFPTSNAYPANNYFGGSSADFSSFPEPISASDFNYTPPSSSLTSSTHETSLDDVFSTYIKDEPESAVPEFKKSMDSCELKHLQNNDPISMPLLPCVKKALLELPSLGGEEPLVEELCSLFIAFTTLCPTDPRPAPAAMPPGTDGDCPIMAELKRRIAERCAMEDSKKASEIIEIARQKHKRHFDRVAQHQMALVYGM
ncbi:hypothetical protein BJ741DRAFT_604023 [Chytriomyces cf. hyalinus JEL632]|nr:hypothetical protein BJ741DRAFT_604023 [Chytriomyces cf. hyalinus JEL632]